MKENYYNILEVANSHGGSEEYMLSLIDEYSDIFSGNIGIKFQPFHYDGLALDDYEWYSTYKKLHFDLEQWNRIIARAFQTKDIWLDIFDVYGISVLCANLDRIRGVKLQSSVLNNIEVLDALSEIDLTNLRLIINIAGREIEEISEYISYFESTMNPKELLLEVGFQNYPTELEDSGLGKIGILKQRFNKKIVFADHVDGKSDDAVILPLMALVAGADVIEKHIMHSVRETHYDHYSSLKKNQVLSLLAAENRYINSINQPFINDRERKYLNNSDQIPIMNKDKQAGDVLFAGDLSFRRTGQDGLRFSEIRLKLDGRYVLTRNVKANSTLTGTDLRKLKIATIIAVRLKSSRLKEKAKQKIGNLSSIELCIKNALRFKDIDYTILATSNLDQDAELRNYTYRDDVVFHAGDPDDVIQRYLDIVEKLGIDVIIRVTGDNPFISADIAEYLINSHLRSGCDYTTGNGAPVGLNLEIINRSALEKVKRHFVKADYSEYMTWYFTNNPEHFKLNFVDLPTNWVRDYRLTLDYEDDLKLYNIIERYFHDNHIEYSIDHLIEFLDNNPQFARINSHLQLSFKVDQELIDKLNRVTKIKSV